MKNFKWEWFVIAGLILIICLGNCKKGATGFFGGCNGNDTISAKKVTTATTTTQVIAVPMPVPNKVEVPSNRTKDDPTADPTVSKFGFIPWPKVTDDTLPPIIDYRYAIQVDTSAILKAYQAKLYYLDSQNFARGSVVIADTVTQNRIIGRSIRLNVTDSNTTNTVTLRQPKRIVGYLGFSWQGNLEDPFYAFGADFSLKGKNDRIYGVGVSVLDRPGGGIFKKGNLLYKVEAKYPLRLFPGLGGMRGK